MGIVGGGGGILVWMLAEILLVELLRSVLIRWKINPETIVVVIVVIIVGADLLILCLI